MPLIATLTLNPAIDVSTSIDQIVQETGLAVPQVLSTISVLEMRHVIRRLSGTMVARV